ncbi:hypothetical protein RHIZ404_200450 [Rhizobium sp. EC-SD404]|nr:hypothetical protein RHIZ404_200450 [Rhizobium sp. EC-SD404]
MARLTPLCWATPAKSRIHCWNPASARATEGVIIPRASVRARQADVSLKIRFMSRPPEPSTATSWRFGRYRLIRVFDGRESHGLRQVFQPKAECYVDEVNKVFTMKS